MPGVARFPKCSTSIRSPSSLAVSMYSPARRVAVARSGLIPDALWPDIASLAAGTERIQLDEPRGGTTVGRHYLYKPGGTQLLYRARTDPTGNPAEAHARLQVVGRLLDAAADAPAAQRALAPLATRLTAARQGGG